MDRFFDARAETYDEHMRAELESFDAFYTAIADAIPATHEPIEILDLGIGTGLELPAVLARVPSARITGIDVSGRMLDRFRDKFPDAVGRVRLIQASFLDVELGRGAYDIAISAMALHHWLPDRKLGLYRRIRDALRPGGLFVNGDYVDDGPQHGPLPTCPGGRDDGGGRLVHVDRPLAVDVEIGLLREGSFDPFGVTFRTPRSSFIAARRRP